MVLPSGESHSVVWVLSDTVKVASNDFELPE